MHLVFHARFCCFVCPPLQVVDYMVRHGTAFLRECVPVRMEPLEDSPITGKPRVRVVWRDGKGGTASDVFDTVRLGRAMKGS